AESTKFKGMFVVVGSLSAQAPAANEGTSGALKPAPLFSRGAATECSPGRKPGVGVVSERSPGGAKDSERLFRPSGAEIVSKENPGLTPGATFCRRSAASHSRPAPILLILLVAISTLQAM